MRRSNDGMRCAKVGMLHPFLAMRCPFPAIPYPLLAMLHPFLVTRYPLLPMRRPFLATLHAFAATRCEGEDASDEESPGHHALQGVHDPSRARGNECVGSSFERETTGTAYVGMHREHRSPFLITASRRSCLASTHCIRAPTPDSRTP